MPDNAQPLPIVLRSLAFDWGSVAQERPFEREEFAKMSRAHGLEAYATLGRRLSPRYLQVLRRWYDGGQLVPLCAFDKDGALIGYNLLMLARSQLTEALELYDRGLYVLPEWRKRGVARGLLEAQKVAAIALNVDECHAGYLSPNERNLAGLYESAGFKPTSITYSWRPGHVL